MSGSRASRPHVGVRVLSRAERTLAILTAIVLFGSLLYTSTLTDAWHRNTEIDAEERFLESVFGDRVDELSTLMSALRTVRRGSADFRASELSALAAKLLSRHEFLSGIGRYEMVPGAERAHFERSVTGHGLYEYRIVDIDAAGARRAGGRRDLHVPVTAVEPLTPANLGMVGADLASIDGLAARARAATADDAYLLARLPGSWTLAGDLIVMHPTYLGWEPPIGREERLRQADGGHWIAIDGERLIDSLPVAADDFDVSVSIGDATVLATRARVPGGKLWFETLFQPNTSESYWSLGDSRIGLRLSHPVGVPPRTVGRIAMLLLVPLLALFAAGAFVARQGRRAERARNADRDLLNIEREKAKRTLDSITEAVLTLDAGQRVVQLNPAAERLLGMRRRDVLGERLDGRLAFDRVGDGQRLDLVALLADATPHPAAREIDIRPVGSHDEDTVLTLSVIATGTPGADAGHILLVRDVSAERRLTRELEHLANHDSLTGCTNRYFFERSLAELMRDRVESERSHALCYIDLDQFKVINDTCGHMAGDRLLKELTEAMGTLVRAGDVLSRLGGDEFGVIVVDVTPEQAAAVADSLFEFFQGYLFQHEDKVFAVRASIGLVHVTEVGGEVDDLMAAADIACYAAKDNGRNGLRVYTATDTTLAERSVELAWLPRLRSALEHDEFRLHMQELAEIGTVTPSGRIGHFEFLLRLSDVDGREVTPWQIIQAAERYDLMRDIDRWVIRNAFDTVARLSPGLGGRCSYSINLSGQSAADPTLHAYIAAELARSGVDPSCIWFELTETAAISHFSTACELFAKLRELGVKIALDDFGSGLSSFGYLKNLPIDVIKIDGQFVRNIVDDPTDREMVRAIHHIGRAMGIETVAEFVENEAILEELMTIGIDYAQGYYLGRPCPVDEAMARLGTGRRAA